MGKCTKVIILLLIYFVAIKGYLNPILVGDIKSFVVNIIFMSLIIGFLCTMVILLKKLGYKEFYKK
jgi:hypothetical protein